MKKIFRIFHAFFNLIFYFLFGGVKYARKIGIEVGKNCRIYTREFGTEPFLIKIENNVTITSGVRFITHDGSGSLVIDEKGRRFYYAHISVGNNVMIGVNSIILPGVKIEDDVIIAAGSVVTKSIPENSIVAGVPAKIIGDFSDFKEKALRDWSSSYDLDSSKPYKERILEVADINFKTYLK